MKISTTLCLALVITLCYFVSVDSTPIQKNDVSEQDKEVARQSGPVVSPPIPGESGDDDDDDDDDGSLINNLNYKFVNFSFIFIFTQTMMTMTMMILMILLMMMVS